MKLAQLYAHRLPMAVSSHTRYLVYETEHASRMNEKNNKTLASFHVFGHVSLRLMNNLGVNHLLAYVSHGIGTCSLGYIYEGTTNQMISLVNMVNPRNTMKEKYPNQTNKTVIGVFGKPMVQPLQYRLYQT